MRTILALLIGLCVTITAIAQPGSGAGGFGSVGPGGGGGPTNGQTAAQVSAAISGGSIIQTNGTGTNTILGTLTVLQGAVANYYFANGAHLRTNNLAPFDWLFANTNGVDTYGTNNVTIGSVNHKNGAAIFIAVASTTGIFGTTLTASNHIGGAYGLTNMNLSTAQASTLPTSAADSSWMPVTNAIAGTNQPMTAGQALVIVGTNTYGATMVKGTNWPTGSQTPVLQDIDFAKFKLINPTSIIWTNKDAGSADSFMKSFNYIQSSGPWTGTILEFTGQSNGVAAASVLKADAGVFGSVLANGGTVSLIPTNASPVLTAANFTGSLPMGITNTLSGRAQPVFQGYAIDAVGGTPILTASNETTGVKLTFSRGASASITPETNWWMLPITTTNTIWKLRDESAGTGASVGILTNWLIGL